jgi:hypothetical protein
MSSNDDEDVDKLFDSSDGEDDAPAPVTTAERGAEHEAEGATPIPDSAAEKDARSSPSPDRGDGAASPVDQPSTSGWSSAAFVFYRLLLLLLSRLTRKMYNPQQVHVRHSKRKRAPDLDSE